MAPPVLQLSGEMLENSVNGDAFRSRKTRLPALWSSVATKSPMQIAPEDLALL